MSLIGDGLGAIAGGLRRIMGRGAETEAEKLARETIAKAAVARAERKAAQETEALMNDAQREAISGIGSETALGAEAFSKEFTDNYLPWKRAYDKLAGDPVAQALKKEQLIGDVAVHFDEFENAFAKYAAASEKAGDTTIEHGGFFQRMGDWFERKVPFHTEDLSALTRRTDTAAQKASELVQKAKIAADAAAEAVDHARIANKSADFIQKLVKAHELLELAVVSAEKNAERLNTTAQKLANAAGAEVKVPRVIQTARADAEAAIKADAEAAKTVNKSIRAAENADHGRFYRAGSGILSGLKGTVKWVGIPTLLGYLGIRGAGAAVESAVGENKVSNTISNGLSIGWWIAEISQLWGEGQKLNPWADHQAANQQAGESRLAKDSLAVANGTMPVHSFVEDSFKNEASYWTYDNLTKNGWTGFWAIPAQFISMLVEKLSDFVTGPLSIVLTRLAAGAVDLIATGVGKFGPKLGLDPETVAGMQGSLTDLSKTMAKGTQVASFETPDATLVKNFFLANKDKLATVPLPQDVLLAAQRMLAGNGFNVKPTGLPDQQTMDGLKAMYKKFSGGFYGFLGGTKELADAGITLDTINILQNRVVGTPAPAPAPNTPSPAATDGKSAITSPASGNDKSAPTTESSINTPKPFAQLSAAEQQALINTAEQETHKQVMQGRNEGIVTGLDYTGGALGAIPGFNYLGAGMQTAAAAGYKAMGNEAEARKTAANAALDLVPGGKLVTGARILGQGGIGWFGLGGAQAAETTQGVDVTHPDTSALSRLPDDVKNKITIDQLSQLLPMS